MTSILPAFRSWFHVHLFRGGGFRLRRVGFDGDVVRCCFKRRRRARERLPRLLQLLLELALKPIVLLLEAPLFAGAVPPRPAPPPGARTRAHPASARRHHRRGHLLDPALVHRAALGDFIPELVPGRARGACVPLQDAGVVVEQSVDLVHLRVEGRGRDRSAKGEKRERRGGGPGRASQ